MDIFNLSPPLIKDTRLTQFGSVLALVNTYQISTIVGTGDFNGGISGNLIPLNLYSSTGLTFQTGLLTAMLAGVTTGGSALQPAYRTDLVQFPAPIMGGGTAFDSYALRAGVALLSTSVTKIGMTMSFTGTQYLTVWNGAGQMIGQVKRTPYNAAGFFGIDSKGIPIAMVALGNDDLWHGASYSVSGPNTYSDTWIWGN